MHPNVPLINFAEPRITMRPEIQTIFICFCKATLAQIAQWAALPMMTVCHRCSSCAQYVIYTVLAKILKYVWISVSQRAMNEIRAPLGCEAAVVVILYQRFGTTYWSHLQG